MLKHRPLKPSENIEVRIVAVCRINLVRAQPSRVQPCLLTFLEMIALKFNTNEETTPWRSPDATARLPCEIRRVSRRAVLPERPTRLNSNSRHTVENTTASSVLYSPTARVHPILSKDLLMYIFQGKMYLDMEHTAPSRLFWCIHCR